MPTEIETKALEALLDSLSVAIGEVLIDADVDYPAGREAGHRISWDEDQMRAALRTCLAALDSPIGEQGVGVKALEWRCVGNGIWEAGHHQVWHQWASDGLWYSSVNVGHRKIERIGDGFKSLEEAQSACQADFNRRIRADLSPERKETVAWTVYDWEYREPDGRWNYARTPERAERLLREGVKLTPVYVPELPATPGQPT